VGIRGGDERGKCAKAAKVVFLIEVMEMLRPVAVMPLTVDTDEPSIKSDMNWFSISAI
jgi:hypothetical protein